MQLNFILHEPFLRTSLDAVYRIVKNSFYFVHEIRMEISRYLIVAVPIFIMSIVGYIITFF